MFVKRISNSSEILTHREIQKGLTPTDHIIAIKLSLSEVIDGSKLQLRVNDKKFLYGPAHFDFVICDSKHMPEFAVEFDGPAHQLYDDKKKRDIRKNRICALAKFPLIRVSDIELEQHDSFSLLFFMVDRFVKWKEDYPKILGALKQRVAKMPESQLEQLTSGGILHPSIDPQFYFDMTHRFPLTGKYREILESKYGILPHSKLSNQDNLWYEIGIGVESTMSERGVHKCKYLCGLYRGGKNCKTFTWNEEGHLTSPEVEIVHEGQVRFTMR